MPRATSNAQIDEPKVQETGDELVQEPKQPSASEATVPEVPTTPPSSVQTTPVQFDFTSHDANEDEMNPVKDVLAAGMEEEAAMMPTPDVITPDELAVFLREAYKLHGMLTIPELWAQEESFFIEIANGIHPKVNEWAASIPAVAHGIKTVSAAGSWGRLIWDYATRWILTIRVMKAKAEDKRQKEQEKHGQVPQNGAGSARDNASGANPYVIDYGAASQPNPTRDAVAPVDKYIVP
ncbi:hypothetical protein [Alicyclobacillus acidoterrestris]|uniref:Uncharacterized protein n=1 Tax=Alicyclobacillus acidoterrestris (strain ATCC 49025 / DSM 3922 / CIP 106132 / NCIMB 13137 / GD3B) TaxID=1356854 RepID=T0BSQ8_ALIAG|nr:hypothetical protein [Alicyclobacillus acidoterrestris]EPZ43844.1 hypothetical protein N007_12055 [Alicyclobacillus acidoterrestris ATCC 49025]UNO49024.1 hypothetical protein K1I37_00155 [Alicyclobacillus acidoterrestris]